MLKYFRKLERLQAVSDHLRILTKLLITFSVLSVEEFLYKRWGIKNTK